MQKGRNLASGTAVIHRCVSSGTTSSNNFKKHLQRKKGQPEIQVKIMKLDNMSGALLGDYTYRNHVALRTKLHVPMDDFPIPLDYIDVQRHKNKP